MSPSVQQQRPLDIALMGTRGIPASYGGFETFAQELSVRLVERGHRVTVYGRSHFVDPRLRIFRGVDIRPRPCLRTKYLETVSHTWLSVLEGLIRPHQVLLICNAANAFLCWIPGLVGQKVVLNVDGLERLRRKWSRLGQAYCRLSEFLATLLPDRTVTDARSVQQYYRREYGFPSPFIPYGAPAEPLRSKGAVRRLGLGEGDYLLYVSRLEPENNASLVIHAYLRSGVEIPLVVVGDAPYGRDYIRRLHRLAEGANVLFPGAIYGTGYRELLAHCACYIHATEVGGTHPALIEAMGAGCLALVNDTPENREVVQEAGCFYPFNDPEGLAAQIRAVRDRPGDFQFYRSRARQRVREAYDWEDVVTQYEGLFHELTARTAAG